MWGAGRGASQNHGLDLTSGSEKVTSTRGGVGGTLWGGTGKAIPDPKATAGVWTGRAGWGCRALENIPSAAGGCEHTQVRSRRHLAPRLPLRRGADGREGAVLPWTEVTAGAAQGLETHRPACSTPAAAQTRRSLRTLAACAPAVRRPSVSGAAHARVISSGFPGVEHFSLKDPS